MQVFPHASDLRLTLPWLYYYHLSSRLPGQPGTRAATFLASYKGSGNVCSSLDEHPSQTFTYVGSKGDTSWTCPQKYSNYSVPRVPYSQIKYLGVFFSFCFSFVFFLFFFEGRELKYRKLFSFTALQGKQEFPLSVSQRDGDRVR